jgi:altronate hydrolase
VIQTGRFAKDFGLASRESFQAFTIQDAAARAGGRAGPGAPARDAELADASQAHRDAGVGTGAGPAVRRVGRLVRGDLEPALGDAADRLVALGGTAILSETPEIYGAEHLLYARAVSGDRDGQAARAPGLVGGLHRPPWREMDNNPSPGNKAGGLTTILEKSLGASPRAAHRRWWT